ncbi:MAG: YARHG domain-containing protein [Flavobacteriales bacterium]|nr:YARHG domain-containing protein [Flavobacteriales bacterium]
MRKPICFLVALLILNAAGLANDGAYLSRGGAIYPMKETRIAMKKEFLSFTCSGDVATVQVLFEFNNPDSVARKLLVGFQAPSGHGDVSDSLMQASRIRDLKVMVDGKLLPITLKAADCEDCPLGEISSFKFHGDSPGIYVYLFEVTFRPGITRVQHSYDFTASSNVVFDRMFNYILTTGSKWAHSAIGDFTLEIDMGKDQYFYVSDVFGKSAEWSIVGTGQVTGHVFGYNDDINMDDINCRMVRTLSGELRIDAKNFAPKNNIEFGVSHSLSFFGIPLEGPTGLSEQAHVALAYVTLDMTNFRVEPLTKEDLRMVRNTIYARHGYTFQDKDLRAFYERFNWYIPDPNLENVVQQLTTEEHRLISEIVALEKTAK